MTAESRYAALTVKLGRVYVLAGERRQCDDYCRAKGIPLGLVRYVSNADALWGMPSGSLLLRVGTWNRRHDAWGASDYARRCGATVEDD